MQDEVVVFWFRRDLRLDDNKGLFHALKSGKPVLPLFIFDTEILDKLEDRKDARVQFIFSQLALLKGELQEAGSDLLIKHGKPYAVFEELAESFSITSVYCNSDYEPYGIHRDREIKQLLAKRKVSFHSFDDHLVFAPGRIVKDDGSPYTVYTPFARRWKSLLSPDLLTEYQCRELSVNFFKGIAFDLPVPESIGFVSLNTHFPPSSLNDAQLRLYHQQRDIPSLDATSRLSIHLRFGTISIRGIVSKALTISDTWLNEFIWREFFMHILFHFPHAVNQSFKPQYDRILWRNDETEFERWCKGETGYPLVDAGMRELNETGFMHNRVRMVTASFLVKHLLVDWRFGEAYFAQKLLDFELSSNNGNWQWSAGSGCDAAPYFRIFNPTSQQQRFDPQMLYVKKWIPETRINSMQPIVDHVFARQRCLRTYREALQTP